MDLNIYRLWNSTKPTWLYASHLCDLMPAGMSHLVWRQRFVCSWDGSLTFDYLTQFLIVRADMSKQSFPFVTLLEGGHIGSHGSIKSIVSVVLYIERNAAGTAQLLETAALEDCRSSVCWVFIFSWSFVPCKDCLQSDHDLSTWPCCPCGQVFVNYWLLYGYSALYTVWWYCRAGCNVVIIM